MSDWVSVDDDMPYGQWVDGWNGTTHSRVVGCFCGDDGNWTGADTAFGITHWMPIPGEPVQGESMAELKAKLAFAERRLEIADPDGESIAMAESGIDYG